MNLPLRIGTRGSPLALAQARLVADALLAAHGWSEEAIEIVPIVTTGDVVQDRPLAEIGGKALWTKELDRALLEGRTDLSVHSMKDVETVRPTGLGIVAVPALADRHDRLIGADTIAALPRGARVGTSSPRRRAQLLARRPDLRIAPIRGNVHTRIARIASGEFDATLLAAAGLERLGLDVGARIDGMLTAPGQGAIGVEAIWAREELRSLLQAIDHRPAYACVDAERAFLDRLGGDCHSAVAAHASSGGAGMWIKAEILSPDGAEVQALEMELYGEDCALPGDAARILLDRAGPALRATFGK